MGTDVFGRDGEPEDEQFEPDADGRTLVDRAERATLVAGPGSKWMWIGLVASGLPLAVAAVLLGDDGSLALYALLLPAVIAVIVFASREAKRKSGASWGARPPAPAESDTGAPTPVATDESGDTWLPPSAD